MPDHTLPLSRPHHGSHHPWGRCQTPRLAHKAHSGCALIPGPSAFRTPPKPTPPPPPRVCLQCGRPRLHPWVRMTPWRRNSNPLQYSCLKNPLDGGAWRATEHGVTASDTTERLHLHFPSACQPPAHVCSCHVKSRLLTDTALCPSCDEHLSQPHELGESVPPEQGSPASGI